MTAARMSAIVLAALVCGAGVVALLLGSDHQDAKTAWAIFGPAVGWSFIGVGLYAWRRRPESRTGVLMVLLGFAWFLSALNFSDSPLVYSLAFVLGGLWGGVFLQLIMGFPSGRLGPGRDRALVIAGYLIFTVASIPAMLFAAPHDLGCDDCPSNVLLIHHDSDLAHVAIGFQVVLYLVLFVMVLVRLILRWRRTNQLERLQLTPVYVCGLLTFLLATAATAGAGDAAGWAVFSATALLPFAFLAGLLRSHVARLDADLRARVVELRASRARLVEAGDTERRRLERNLHDGAQARLVGAGPAARPRAQARRCGPRGDRGAARPRDDRAAGGPRRAARARARHPPGGAHRARPGARAARARLPRPGARDGRDRRRAAPPGPVEAAAYFVVSEALANVAKYAQATEATVAVRRTNGCLTVDSPTTASAAPTRPRARACAASATASPRSTARSRSTARGPRHAPARRDPLRVARRVRLAVGIGRKDQGGAVGPQPALRRAVARAVALQERPEAPRVIHDHEVARLVPDDVVEDLLGAEQQAPVEAHRAGGRARAPARALLADGELRVRTAERRDGLVEARRDLGARRAPVPALDRRPRLVAGHEQRVTAAVRAQAPGLGRQGEVGAE